MDSNDVKIYVQRVCHRSDRWWPWNFKSDIEIIVEINLCAKLCSTYWRFAHPLLLPCIFPTKNHQDVFEAKDFLDIPLTPRKEAWSASYDSLSQCHGDWGFLEASISIPIPIPIRLSIMHPGILSIKISPIIHGFSGKWPKVFFGRYGSYWRYPHFSLNQEYGRKGSVGNLMMVVFLICPSHKRQREDLRPISRWKKW